MTLSVTLPTSGDTPWDGVLNTAINNIVTAVNALPSGGVTPLGSITGIWTGSASAYAALGSYTSTVLYAITP